MKEPQKSIFVNVMKIRFASVAWKISLYHRDKNFRLCKCATLKSSCTNVVKVWLCQCSVQWYLRKDFRLCRCKPLKSFSESLKKSGWISVALNNFVSTDFKLCRCSVAHVKYCRWRSNCCRLCWCYLEI